MFNELLFIVHSIIISLFALGALTIGPYALAAFVCIQCLLANLFVIKQITLFGFNATATDAFTIGAVLGLNLLQEYYGRDIARKTIWINFFLLIFYAIVSQIHVLYTPSPSDFAQICFVELLNFMPRIVVASFTVYLISQTADYLLYGFLKRTWKNKWLIVRNYTSITITQLLDTVLFSFLGLYGIIDHIWEVIAISYSIKLVAIIVATPFVGLSRWIFKK